MALADRLAALGQQAQDEDKAERRLPLAACRLPHHHSERGNAARVFVGMDFREQADG